LKILAKLLSAFLGVALICAVIGGFGVSMVGSLNATIEKMNAKTIPSITYLDTISKEFRTILGAIHNLANPRGGYTPGFIDEQFATIDASRATYRPVYDLYDALPKTAEEQKLWDAVKDTLTSGAAYTNTTSQLAKKVQTMSNADEIAATYGQINAHVFGPNREAFNVLFANLEKNLAYVTDYYGVQEAERAAKTGTIATATMLAASAIGLAIAVLLGLLFGTTMSRTVKKTVAAIDKIARGDMTAKLETKARDEFRQVAGAIDQVTATLTMMVAEADLLTNAALEGRLTFRGDEGKFSGGYREVIAGVNASFDALVSFIDNIPTPCMSINKDFEIQFMNKAGAALGAMNSLDLVASRRKCFDFFRTGDCRTQNCACSRSIQSNGVSNSSTIARPLDQSYDISYSAVPLHSKSGAIVGAMEVIVDQTAIKNAERKMNKIAAFQNEEIARLKGNLQKISQGNLDCDLAVSQSDEDTRETAELFVTISNALGQSVKAIESLVADTDMLSEAAIAGALQTRADSERHLGDFQKVILGINRTLDLVITPINETIAAFKLLAEGDLTAEITGDYKGDFDVLKTALNESLRSINQTLSQINIAVDQVAEGAVQVSQASQSLSQGASEQASSLEEITSSTTEIASQTKQNTENALRMNTLARSAQDNATSGNAQMKDLVLAMNDINTSAEEIKKVVKTIDDISFQINLLALNANVEAARAGKYGKGFAVVAEAVRNLAVRSAESVKDTTRMVEEAITNIQRGNELVTSTAGQLDQIVDGASQVSEIAEEVATASREQTQGLDQISLGLNQIDQVTQSNTASAEQSASASEELSSQAQQVKSMLSRFKIRAAEREAGNAELLAMLRAELARRGIRHDPVGANAPAVTRGASGFSSQAAKPAAARRTLSSTGRAGPLNPADIISLDDNNFGKF